MKKLKVIIAGEAGTGKSSLLSVIETLLKKEGYDVELLLEGTTEILDYGTEDKFHAEMLRNADVRKKVLKERKIILTTQQLARGSQR